jgi:hypothetical protein
MGHNPAGPARPHTFDSFWIGGFEAATHINGARKRLDMLAAKQPDQPVEHD